MPAVHAGDGGGAKAGRRRRLRAVRSRVALGGGGRRALRAMPEGDAFERERPRDVGGLRALPGSSHPFGLL